MSISRFSTGLRKMSPGTIGGQSRVATPVHRRAPFNIQTLRPELCGVTITAVTFNSTSSVVVDYPAGDAGDRLDLLITLTSVPATPAGWSLYGGVAGLGNVYTRRDFSKTRSEDSITLDFGSPQSGTVVIVNMPVGPPPPQFVGTAGFIDDAYGTGTNGDFTEDYSMFTSATPGHLVLVPWHETAAACDTTISASAGGSALTPYIDFSLDLPLFNGHLCNQRVIAAIGPVDDYQLFGNFIVPGSAVTRAVWHARIAAILCS